MLSTICLLPEWKVMGWGIIADCSFCVFLFKPKIHHYILLSPADHNDDDSIAISLTTQPPIYRHMSFCFVENGWLLPLYFHSRSRHQSHCYISSRKDAL